MSAPPFRRTDPQHIWHFAAVIVEKTIHSVATCSRCGLIRTGEASPRADDAYVDLTGDCSGEPRKTDVPMARS